MLRTRLVGCLAADQARLRQAASTDLTAPVPTCPDWRVEDLVRHVAVVYLHKVECMRSGRAPEKWPPDVSGDEPLALLDHAYRALRAEFDQRDPAAAAPTWYDPDQTVGFWIRRMAQETVMHRVDAELATGEPVADIPADLATDGVDEVLQIFLAYGARRWPENFAEVLPTSPVRVEVTTGEASWLIRLGPDGAAVDPAPRVGAGAEERTWPGAEVEPGASGAAQAGPEDVGPVASVRAEPDQLLCWLWRRSPVDAVTWTGDRAAVDRLRLVLVPATQ